MTVRFLCYGDLHLGPSGETDLPPIPSVESGALDAIVSIGDVIDDNVDHADSAAAGQAYEERGRAFFERLDDVPAPVVAVPGNHDPVATTERLTDGLDSVTVAHERVVDSTVCPALPEDVAFVGWGCEQFDITQTFPYTRYPSLNPVPDATPGSIHHDASEVADRVRRVLGGMLDDAISADEAIDRFDIDDERRGQAHEDLRAFETAYDRLAGLLSEATDPTVVLSHDSPFGTALDYHHSADSMYGRLHSGSIVLRLAIERQAPTVTLSGHMHVEARDVVETDGGHRDVFNPGSPGIALVEIDTETNTVHIDSSLSTNGTEIRR